MSQRSKFVPWTGQTYGKLITPVNRISSTSNTIRDGHHDYVDKYDPRFRLESGLSTRQYRQIRKFGRGVE